MKKNQSALLQVLILLLLGAAVILTLVLPQLGQGDRTAPPVELSVVIREADSSLWQSARLGMEQAAGELGGELRFLTLTWANSGQEQAELLHREAAGGAQALVVVPAASQELAGEVKKLAGACPVVCLESSVEGTALTVAPDNAALGAELARAVLEDWTGGAVLLLDTAQGSAGVSQRLEAACQVLEEADVPILRRSCPAGTHYELDSLLREVGACQVVAFEPSATELAVEVKENGGLRQPLYGVGSGAKAVGGLERGTVSAVVAWSDYAAGYMAVEGAIRIARGEAYFAGPLPFYVVRGEDIYEPDIQKLLFPVTA